ncbi:MAG: prolipoprotein diacylglyceryl transferase family protein [Bacteroidota bacterium]
MYPTISDLLRDIFGINIPLPIQSFGFFVAISFLLAAYTLSLELRRKETLGLISPFTRKVLTGAPATWQEILLNVIIGFVLGYKLIYFGMNYSSLVDNPQKALLSMVGSIPGGILAAAAMGYWKYREKNKVKKEKPEWVEEVVAPHELVGNITMVAAVSGLLGAKIFHNLEYPEDLLKDPIDALLSFSGLTMYGGLIVGAIATIWYGKKHGIAPMVLSDATAAGLMLAYGFGRIGCQVAGDGDWGIVNTSPKPSLMSFLPDWFWSYNYPHNVISEGIPIPDCIGKHCYMLEQPVFPTPLYESIVCILFFFLLWSIRKKFTVPGKFFSLYLLLNGVERFAVESIRVNSKYHVGEISFTQAQLISLLLIITGIAGLYFFKKKKPENSVA